jgi:DNA-binding transcriptional ArsR family regulator
MMDLDRLVHEPARLAILALLSGVDEADFLFLQREAGLTKGNLSAHLSRLQEAGYVGIDKMFRSKTPLTVVRITREGRSALLQYSKSVNWILRWVK